MDPVLADRLQFAFTVMFHYLFPIGTMGLAPFVAAYTWKAARDFDEESGRIARFWTKIFAINFAAGVVTGIPMEFQFGTNWAAFSRRSGAVVGQPLAMESMFAFFLESMFLGVLLYRRRGYTVAVRGLGGRCGLRSARGSPDISSLPQTLGCSIPSATHSQRDGTIAPNEYLGRPLFRRSCAGSSCTCLPAALLAGGVHCGRHRRVLFTIASRGGDRRSDSFVPARSSGWYSR